MAKLENKIMVLQVQKFDQDVLAVTRTKVLCHDRCVEPDLEMK